MAPRRSLRLR